MKLALFVIGFIFSISATAHEGHAQNPKNLKALHGGAVKTGKEINLEYVISGTEVKLYPVSHDGKPVPSEEIKLSATTRAAKAKKATPASLKYADNSYSFAVDFGGTHRVEVMVTTESKGKSDVFKFQVEK